ncbi:MAG: YkgJ family cysteine cluster protein, partial [Myxococcota bacterium]
PAPAGQCAFLDGEKACRIYPVRPYVCRSQGVPLRWIDGKAERRDICPLNEAGEPLETLSPEECFTLGPVEERLALLQALRSSDERIALRDLFSLLAGG